MPKLIEGLDKYGDDQAHTGFFDRYAPDQPTIIAEKVLDITDLTIKETGQAILKYCRDSRTPLVLLQNRHEADNDVGTMTLLPLNESILDLTFQIERFGDSWGIEPGDLLEVIISNAPESPFGGLDTAN